MKNIFTALCLLCSFSVFSQNSLKGFGDSNTEFWADLPKEKKWFAIVGKELNLNISNYAHAGATIYGANGLETERSRSGNGPKDYLSFMFGTNDAATLTITPQWKADYKNYIQDFIRNGYQPQKIFLISPNYDPADTDLKYQTQLLLVRQYCMEIAKELNINFVDLYGEMKFIFESPDLSVYYKPVWSLVGGKHLTERGHRLLADIFENAYAPTTYENGEARVKLFGAGSAMAGISSWHHSFIQLFGKAKGKQAKNYAIAGTGIADLNLNDVKSGTKEIIVLLYGNNDGNGTEAWKTLYKSKVQEVIAAGYALQNIVLMTVTRSPGLQTNEPVNFKRIGEANKSIREIASELNVRLLDIDQMSLTFADDYHINDEANEIVAKALQSLFANTPLSVKFSQFNAKCLNGTVTLNWETESESNSKRFDVENSNDGSTWQVIGSVNASGTSTTIKNYSFSTIKTGFFRIVEYGNDNKKTISSIVKADCNTLTESLNIYPNPVINVANITIASTKPIKTTLKVFDLRGMQVKQQQLTLSAGTNQVRLDVSGLSAGTYTATLQLNEEVKTIKFLKN